MAQPRTKAELQAATDKERNALQLFLTTLTREQLLWPGAYGWSAKDHIAHLADWERLFFGWYDAGTRGENPPLPAEGYTWADMDALNQKMYEFRRNDQLEHVLADWNETSRRLGQFTQAMNEPDLFTQGRFAWTGRGTLAGYVFECGPNHYRWSAIEIKRGLKVKR